MRGPSRCAACIEFAHLDIVHLDDCVVPVYSSPDHGGCLNGVSDGNIQAGAPPIGLDRKEDIHRLVTRARQDAIWWQSCLNCGVENCIAKVTVPCNAFKTQHALEAVDAVMVRQVLAARSR